MADPVAAVGIYGKHPAFGDFVGAGWPAAVQAAVEGWLNTVLPALRDADPDNWKARFDGSPDMRFWFGPLALGGVGLAGIIRPSRDRVGRRFPLVAGVAGSDLPAPVIDGQQRVYDALTGALDTYARAEGQGAGQMAAALAAALPAMTPSDDLPAGFWAARSDGDVAALWADVALADQTRAVAGRSYLWAQGAGGAALYASDGLPGADVLLWLMSGAVAARPTPEEAGQEPDPDPGPETAPPDKARPTPEVTPT